MKLTQTTGPNLGRQKPKGRKNSTLKPEKGDLKHSKLKKKIMKRQRNTAQMKDKLETQKPKQMKRKQTNYLKKIIQNNDSKYDQNLENKMETIK